MRALARLEGRRPGCGRFSLRGFRLRSSSYGGQALLSVTTNTPSRSRRALRPRFAGNSSPSKSRGRRECRVRAAPAVSCAMGRRSAHMSIQVQREHPGLPCAMALRLITCSPRRTALLPPLRPEKQLPPGALTPAPRRQDHTSSPYASMPFAIGTASVHRDPPHDRGDHDTPLWSGRDGDKYAPDLAFG
jgi:hypothetical protein